MAVENNGKPAANDVRITALPVSAAAAIGRNAVTRYVNVLVNTKQMPTPKGIEEMMGAIQWTCWYVVNARQYSPMGTRIPPTFPMASHTSGGGLLLYMHATRRR